MASLTASVGLPASVTAAVLGKSKDASKYITKDTPSVQGFDFQAGPPTLDGVLETMLTTGFQATNLGLAIEEINRMRRWRLSDEPVKSTAPPELRNPEVRARTKATIFLSFTSNMISSGVRETIRFLVQNRMVDVLCTTCGGI